jgi:hypothetical protein
LLTISARDDRANPGHARKMAAQGHVVYFVVSDDVDRWQREFLTALRGDGNARDQFPATTTCEAMNAPRTDGATVSADRAQVLEAFFVSRETTGRLDRFVALAA